MTRERSTHSPEDIDITQLWRAVSRNKAPLVAFVLLSGILTYAFLTLLTPQYTSVAQILLERDESPYTRARGEGSLVDPNRIDEEQVTSQVQVILSRDLALQVAKDAGLFERNEFAGVTSSGVLGRIAQLMGLTGGRANMTVEERVTTAFAERLSAYRVAKSRVIAVEFSSQDRELAAKVANALADRYIMWRSEGRVRSDVLASESIGRKLEEMRDAAEKSAAELERFRSEAGLVTGTNDTTLNAQQLSELSSQVSQAEAQRSEAEARARLIREMLARGDIDSAPEVLRAPLIQRVLEQRVRVERQLAELSATLLPAHPRMRQLSAELEGLRRQIRDEAIKVVRSLEGEEKVARARVTALRAGLDGLSKRAEESGGATAKIRLLEREATSKRELYEAYLGRFGDANARSDVLATSASASRILTATAPTLPSFPRKGPITLLVMAGSLVFGLILIVARELLGSNRASAEFVDRGGGVRGREGHGSLDARYGSYSGATASPAGRHAGYQLREDDLLDIRPREDLDRTAELDSGSSPSVSEMPESAAQYAGYQKSQSPKPADRLAAETMPRPGTNYDAVEPARGPVHRPQAVTHEIAQIESLAEFLSQRAQGEPGFRSLVVEDGVAEDGRNFALGVARLIAEQGGNALLIDWRQGDQSIARLQGIAQSPGLCELAAGTHGFDKVVHRDALSRCQVIVRGSWPDEQADGQRLGLVLDALDEAYDHILITADSNGATELFDLLEGRFDAGIYSGARMMDGMFLGRKAIGIDVVHLAGTPASAALETTRGNLGATDSRTIA